MPIYDYRCDHCGHVFSAVQGFDDPVIASCPSCGKTPRRLIVPPAIVFKGSGWYKTDSRPKTADDAGAAKPAPAADARPSGTTPAPEGPKKSEAAS